MNDLRIKVWLEEVPGVCNLLRATMKSGDKECQCQTPAGRGPLCLLDDLYDRRGAGRDPG